MVLRVPRNAACIENHVVLAEDHKLQCLDGHLQWTLDRADEGRSDSVGDFREDEIVFICREAEPEHGSPGTNSGRLRYSIFLVRENSGSADEPFRLTRLSASRLPQELLDRHLLADAPVHLVGAADDDDDGSSGGKAPPPPGLHVVVSTKSGLGLANAVYHDVLAKLLAEVLGLHPACDLTTPESQGGRGGRASGRPARSYNLILTQSRHSIRELARARWSAEAQKRQRKPPIRDEEDGEHHRQQDGQQLIILLSGDGGVVDLLNGAGEPSDDNQADAPSLSSTLPTIALLPLGTGNAMFHSLHRPFYQQDPAGQGPSHLVRGLRTLFRGAAAPLPTFRASFSPGSALVPPAPPAAAGEQQQGAVATGGGDDGQEGTSSDNKADAAPKAVDHLLGAIVASYGFHAQLVWESDTPEYRRHGAKRFGMAAAELLKIGHAYDAEVRLRRPGDPHSTVIRPRHHHDDDDQEDDRFTYVLAAMTSNLERTFTISPAAAPLDGRLRLVSFGAVGAAKTMEIMQAAYDDGAHVRMTWPSRGDRSSAAADNDNNAASGAGINKAATAGLEDDDDDDRVVGYNEVDEVLVTTHEEDARWRKVCIDGTIVELPRHGSMNVRKMTRSRFRVLADPRVL